MKFFIISAGLILSATFFSGCQKTQLQQAVIEPYESLGEYRLMTPAYYRESANGMAIEVRFYESPRIFELFKSDPNFSALQKTIDDKRDSKSPIRIFSTNEKNPLVTITSIQLPSSDDLIQFNQLKVITPESATIKKVVPTMALLNEIFAFFQEQGCTSETSSIDYCIPFQYVVDGCYARAHKMRQILINDYGYSCEKVFSYEGTSGYLAVDAGDCCVYWWYHVAPLVSVRGGHGTIKKFVMDPSMFSSPVSIETWTAAQENFDCTTYADFGYSDITPGQVYGPGGYTDEYYSSTNWTLQYYADLVTCP